MLKLIQYWPNIGYVLQGNVREASGWIGGALQGAPPLLVTPSLVVADPPYGNIVEEDWDVACLDEWIGTIRSLEIFEAPIYWWGGIGKPDHRPFFEFILQVEKRTQYKMRDLITWKKKRGYGRPKDYLFTREECAYLTLHGQEPDHFKIPLLDKKRGYSGYNAEYPAKSEYLRRSNVWDETELLRNKLHTAHKAPVICQIPIKVHTVVGDWVLDLYSGSGEFSVQALRLGRKFIAVEQDRAMCDAIVQRIHNEIDSVPEINAF